MEENKINLLPVKNDYVFARLFGAKSHKRVLVCLLNSILNGKPHIKDITLDPNEYKKTSPDGKSIRLDIAATSDDSTIFNIEIQCKDEGNIGDRASFYQSKLREGKLKEALRIRNGLPQILSKIRGGYRKIARRKYLDKIVRLFEEPANPASVKAARISQGSPEYREIMLLLIKL